MLYKKLKLLSTWLNNLSCFSISFTVKCSVNAPTKKQQHTFLCILKFMCLIQGITSNINILKHT